MFHLLSGGVKDALPTVNLHADVQLKIDVSFSCWATEATVCRSARPAFAEQLTHSRKPRGLLMRCLTEEKICNIHLFVVQKALLAKETSSYNCTLSTMLFKVTGG